METHLRHSLSSNLSFYFLVDLIFLSGAGLDTNSEAKDEHSASCLLTPQP